MRAIHISTLALAVSLAGGAATARAQKKNAPPPPPPLTEEGRRLEARYAARFQALKTEIEAALPKLDEARRAAFLEARKGVQQAEAEVARAERDFGKIAAAEGQVNHAKGKWIGGAEKGIEEAQEALKKAATPDERKAAQAALAKWQADLEAGRKALQERQAALKKIKQEEPKLRESLNAARQGLAAAQARMLQAIRGLALESFLGSDALDPKLVPGAVLAQATPRGLAEFAQQGPESAALVEQLLADTALMKRMLVAGGPVDNRYGPAMKIYTDILKASPRAREGMFNRLALAVSLEHATPIPQSNPQAWTDAPAFVDPVARYRHYEQAFLAGELDPAFSKLTAWDYRMVVDSDAPDSILAWGREMLRNYRPDHIYTKDYGWRYVAAVRTEVKYGSQDVKNDLPTLQHYQNIIMNGGICGRRAWFGGFMLRAFGIPIVRRPQPGHAALAHWTPNGWVVNLGAGWGAGWTKYGKDLDFLAVTQARRAGPAYLQVLRAQWIGDILGEKRAFGLHSQDIGFWNTVALYRQQAIIEDSRAVKLAALGEELGESNEAGKIPIPEPPAVTDEDRRTVVEPDGTIRIPAVGAQRPRKSTGKVLYMKGFRGGGQLHYSRNGAPETFEYAVEVPAAGRYALGARVVTTSANQRLLVTVNDAPAPIEMPVPFTVGQWEDAAPIEIALREGKNVLTFTAPPDNKGITIRNFALRPLR